MPDAGCFERPAISHRRCARRMLSESSTCVSTLGKEFLTSLDMRDNPCESRDWARILLAASEGWNPSQNTYSVAFEHVPGDIALHRNEVSRTPVPQQAFLASANPAMHFSRKETDFLSSSVGDCRCRRQQV